MARAPRFLGDNSSSNFDNGTNNVSTDSADTRLLFQMVISSFGIVFCVLTALVQVSLLTVLKRCRKMPTALKWLSLNFVSCNILNYVIITVMSLFFLTLDPVYVDALFDLRIIMAGSTYSVGCGITTGLSLERYFKLTYPFKFEKIISNTNVTIYIIFAWLLGVIVPFTICFDHFVKKCNSTLRFCTFSSVMETNIIFINCVLILSLLLILWTVFAIKKQVRIQIFKILKSTQVFPLRKLSVPNAVGSRNVISTSHGLSFIGERTQIISQRISISENDSCESSGQFQNIYGGFSDFQRKREPTVDCSVIPGTTNCLRNENGIACTTNQEETKIVLKVSQTNRRSQSRSQRETTIPNKVQLSYSSESLKNVNFRATRNMLKIIITYVVFHIAMILPVSFFILFPELKVAATRSLLQVFSFLCSLVSSYIALYLYIWKFRECKMLFLITFFSWNTKLYEKGKLLKIDVYNIVPSTNVPQKVQLETSRN